MYASRVRISEKQRKEGTNMKVIICGDRHWTDRAMVENFIKSLPEGTTIIQGECNGADQIAKQTAKALHYPVSECYATNWELHGLAAGPIRNRQMLKEKPDLVIAFHDNIALSKGTKDMLNAAKSANVRTLIFSHNSSFADCKRGKL